MERVLKIVSALFLMFALLNSVSALSAVPEKISYQGRLSDVSGNPLDGIHQINFSLYDLETGGLPIWTEQQSVTVENGIFSVRLGAVTPFAGNEFENPVLYLELEIYNSDSTSWETLAPRQELSSTAYARKAANSDRLEGNSIADLDATYMRSDAGYTNSLTVGGTISVGTNTGDDDDYLQMDAGNEYLQWNEYQTRFQFSDALNVEGALTVGYRSTQPVYSVIGYGTPESGVISDINDLLVTNDLEVGGYIIGDNITSNGYVRAYGTLYVGTDTADDDDYIRMDSGYEYLRWDEDLDDDSGNGLDGGFYFSDEIVADGEISSLVDVTAAGDMVIAGTTGKFKYDTPRTRRLNIPACAFVKDDAYPNAVWNMTSSYAYTSTEGTSGYCYAYAPIYLPEGATVTGVQIQYYDNDSTLDIYVTFALRRASITSTSSQNLSYGTATSSGDSTTLRVAEDDDLAYTSIENNYNYSMYLAWNPTGLSHDLRFYGASITYTVDTVD